MKLAKLYSPHNFSLTKLSRSLQSFYGFKYKDAQSLHSFPFSSSTHQFPTSFRFSDGNPKDYKPQEQENISFADEGNTSSKSTRYLTAAAIGISALSLIWNTSSDTPSKCEGFLGLSWKTKEPTGLFQHAPSAQQAGFQKIADYLGSSKYSLDFQERESISTDTSHLVGKVPEMIVYPESTEEVSETLKLCNHYNIPVLPYGSGTSLEGNAVCMNGGIVINMGRMSKIKKLSIDDSDVTVGAGIRWTDLNDQIKETGLFYPIDPGPGASIGGMIATRCSGTNAVRYGVMKDWVLSITVVLIDGTIMKLGSRARKDAAGYDLVRLFCGSDGTLGVITEATLKLSPIPKYEYVAICTFPSIKNACECVQSITKHGVQIGCAEMLDSDTVTILNEQLEKPIAVAPCIMFKFTGNKAQVEEAIEFSQKIAKDFGGQDFTYRTAETGSAELWDARKQLFSSYISGLPENIHKLSTDVCVPVGELPDFAAVTKKEFSVMSQPTYIFGHVGDGNFHMIVPYNNDDPKEVQKIYELYSQMIKRAIDVDGTCTGEHGIGVGKKKYLKMMYNKETLDLMKKLKKVFDPKGLMNPGKVFD